MIQSPSLSALSMIPAAGDVPMPAAPEGAEIADFGALLALSTGQAVPANSLAAPDQADLPSPTGTLAGAATTGKDLPLDLPLAVPVSEPERRSSKPKTDAPDPCDLPPTTLPQSKTGVPIQRVLGKVKPLPDSREAVPVEAREPATPTIAQSDAALPVQAALPIAVPISIAAATPAPLQVPVMEPPAPAKDDRQPQGSSIPQPAQAALAHAAPQAAFLRTVFPAQRGPEQGATPVAPLVQQGAPQPAASLPQPIAQVRIEVAPVPPVMRVLAKDDLRPAPVSTLPDISVTPVTTNSPAASAAPVQLTLQPLPQADRPQDFSALIDRLVAAREAAGPQAVAVSVAHADFGQVHLRFRQDEAGLAVSMASADPAFARAASAMPPVLPVGDAQNAQLQPGQRQDSAAASSQSGTGQQRGSTGERQGDQPHNNHSPRQAHPGQSGPGRQARRAGIFA